MYKSVARFQQHNRRTSALDPKSTPGKHVIRAKSKTPPKPPAPPKPGYHLPLTLKGITRSLRKVAARVNANILVEHIPPSTWRLSAAGRVVDVQSFEAGLDAVKHWPHSKKCPRNHRLKNYDFEKSAAEQGDAT